MTWPIKKLGEVIEINYGKGLPKENRIDSGKYFAYGSNGPVYGTDKSLTKSETIVIGRKGTAGALYFISDPCWPIDTTFFAKPKSDVSLKFIYYLLRTKRLPRLAIVTGVPGINRTTLANINVQLPPLTTQKQIVERLDKITEAQKLNDGLIKKTDELFQSLLHKELDPVGKDWEIKELQEIVEARSGFGFSMEIQGKTDGEIPFYKVSDMNLAGNQIEMVYHNNTITTKQCADRRYKPAPEGTIIFPKIGAAVATNKKRILTRDSLYDNNVMGLIPTAKILSKYLFFWMLKFDISLWASQSMPPSIKKSTVDKFTIPLPSLKIQKQIVVKLSAVQDYKKQLLEQKTKLKELFDSALASSMKA